MKTCERSQLSSNHMGFKRNIIDLLDLYQHKIILHVDKDDSVFRDAKENAETVVNRIIGEENIIALKRGRLYNRGVVADILTEFWEKSPTRDVDFWKDLIGNIETLHESMLRNDADDLRVYPEFKILSNSTDAAEKRNNDTVTPSLQQTCEVDEELSKKKLFMENYTEIIDRCRIQEYASMIHRLQKLQNSGDNYRAQVKECKEFVTRNFDETLGQQMLFVFQEPYGYGYGMLKAPKEVNEILQKMESLQDFQAFFTKTLRAWESTLSIPKLVKLQYDIQPDDASRPVDGNKAVALQQATEELSRVQRIGPDPTTIAEAIASKAIPDRYEDAALKVDELSSLPDAECTMKKRKTTDAAPSSLVTDDDARLRPLRRRIPPNFFHNEFSQKGGLPLSEELGEIGDILMIESDEEMSSRRQNASIGDTAYETNTSETKINALSSERMLSRKVEARKEATNRKSGNEFSITREVSPPKDPNFAEKQVEIKVESRPEPDPDEEKPSRCHGILAPAVRNNNNAPIKSPPRKKANKSFKKSLLSGQLEEAKGTMTIMSHCPGEQSTTGQLEHTENNQENQEVFATIQVGDIEPQESARERKKRETTITFDDSDASVQSPNELPSEHTDNTNTRRTAVEASNHLQESINRIIGKRRRAFTQEEKNALRLGIKKFGVGKWSLIKSEYSEIFRYRTTVQIKDLHRTMAKQSAV